MARNNYFQSAFGPSMRNEASGASAASADAGGPLPGMMPMTFGDAVEEVLPPAALETFRALQLRRDEASTLVRATVEDQQEVRLDVLGHQARIKRLTQHSH